MFLEKCFPEFFIILRDEIEWRGKTQIMAVVCQQLHAEAVDGAKESTIKGRLNRGRTMLFQNALPCSLLHFVGRAMGKRDHDKLRQYIEGIAGPGELDDALGNCVGFARTGGSDHGEIAVEFFGETAPGGMVARLVHQNISSSSRTSAGCVNSQRCSRMSGSIASVARG